MGATLQGLFLADFSDFVRECETARTKLADFAAGADKVGPRLNAMIDTFSGRKVIQDAQLMAEAIERIGGVSQLTEKELERVSATAKEAAAKMVAMGVDVPPGIQRIADEAKTADKAHGGMLETVKNLALGFAALFTVRAAFNFAKDVLDDASALADLSQQTHIGIEDLQVLSGAMSEFGVDADTLGKGLFKLSKGIAGEDASVAHGLALMGMALKDVEGLNGKELFLKIENGLAKLQGGLRDTAASELFGSKLGAAMAGASEGIDGAIEKWQALNHVASDESVKALDEFGESIARAQKGLTAMATSMMGPVAQGFNVLNDAAEKGASKWAIAWAMAQDWNDTMMTGQTQTSHLTTLLNDLNLKTEDNAAKTKAAAGAHRDVTAAIESRTTAEQFLAALEANAAKDLTASQLENLKHLKDIGQLNEANAVGIGVSAGQYAKYITAVGLAAKADADRATAHKAWLADETAAQNAYADLLTHLHQVALGHQKEFDAARTKQTAVTNAAQAAELAAQLRLNAALGVEAPTAAETLRVALAKLHAEGVTGISQKAQEAELYAAYNRSLAEMAGGMGVVGRAAITMAGAAGGAIDTMAGGVGGAIDMMAAKAVAKIDEVAQKANAAVAAAQQYSMVGGTQLDARGLDEYYKTPAGIAEIIRNGGRRYWEGGGAPRASGGPVSAGKPYLIGERGPELFVPSSAGSILPNGSGGSGVTVNATIYVNGTAADVARQVSAEILRTIKAGQQLGAN